MLDTVIIPVVGKTTRVTTLTQKEIGSAKPNIIITTFYWKAELPFHVVYNSRVIKECKHFLKRLSRRFSNNNDKRF